MTCSYCEEPAQFRITGVVLIAFFCPKHMYAALKQGIPESNIVSLRSEVA